MKCRRCDSLMRPGIALGQTYGGIPDFPDGHVCTVSPAGSGRVIPCLKCSGCGHSVSVPEHYCVGKAECIKCGRKWVAVWPLGADALECPSCGSTDTDREAE